MIQIQVNIKGLANLRENFQRAPATTLKYLGLATQASIAEVEKQAIDPNFRFKTPRSRRTGYLALSFQYGRRFSLGGLRGAIGPTAHYAPHVYWGTRGSKGNPFMDRIAKAATPGVEKHFQKAVDLIVRDLAKI